ncbi:MAG: hypothetical protein JNL28_00240 [Planctomycetes bacterium]|nr:hypothetical protein [Planctomycetota bacterium]
MKAPDERTVFDDLRAWSAGTLSEDERARFEHELALDPEKARLAADFQAVWKATEIGAAFAHPSKTTFDQIVARTELDLRPLHRRRVAAAAACVFLALAAWLAWERLGTHAGPPVVELRSVPLNASDPRADEAPALPALLADWSPVRDGGIQWLDSPAAAQAVSAAVARPIFVYGYVEQCPICRGFQRDQFQDPAILALVEKSVPLKIDLLALEESEMQELWSRRYPLLEMQDERGTILRTFPGTFADVDMRDELDRALAGAKDPDWGVVRRLTALFLLARDAESKERWTAASPALTELAAHEDLPNFAAAGRNGLARMAAAAARIVEEARVSAKKSSDSALSNFEEAAARFSGTPFEPDLRAVQAAWRRTGRFPELKQQS